ncbi:hypothetical protein AGRO_1684 [Agrobacterium sp. ATCC 31749]|nr:hypothetical protein AGRO_1684 [Agrobacterium sp. ATCC 31749]
MVSSAGRLGDIPRRFYSCAVFMGTIDSGSLVSGTLQNG